MPDAIQAAFLSEGFVWMAIASFMAGLVRGFSGFGSGLVLLPVTAMFLSPFAAITAMTVADFFGPLPLVRNAVGKVHMPDLLRLFGAMLVGLPIGIALLLLLDPELFRFGVSLLAIVILALLIGGVRYHGRLTPRLVLTSGGAAGVLGGIVGLPGPPVILLYLASALPAAVVRATTLLFLFLYDIMLVVFYAISGQLVVGALTLGALLAIPNLLGNLAGATIFRPGAERFYRAAAYTIIAISAIIGLPYWR